MTYNQHTDWECSFHAARTILRPLLEAEKVASMVDFGCGLGAWLNVAAAIGVEVVGLDAHEDSADLLRTDLTAPVDLGRRFDLAISLEVGEHLPESAAITFVDSICRHSDLILFSAATPGQGGDGHINEQPHYYWDSKFAARGYQIEPVDVPDDVAFWYRNNVRLFRR